jgi:hypothetical protein
VRARGSGAFGDEILITPAALGGRIRRPCDIRIYRHGVWFGRYALCAAAALGSGPAGMRYSHWSLRGRIRRARVIRICRLPDWSGEHAVSAATGLGDGSGGHAVPAMGTDPAGAGCAHLPPCGRSGGHAIFDAIRICRPGAHWGQSRRACDILTCRLGDWSGHAIFALAAVGQVPACTRYSHLPPWGRIQVTTLGVLQAGILI